MRRFAPIGLAVLVAGAVAALILMLRSGSGSEAGSEPGPRAQPAQRSEPSAVDTRGSRSRPALPAASAGDDEGAAGKKKYVEYLRADGTLVRDHRAQPQRDEAVPGQTRRPGSFKVQPDSIVAVRNSLRPIVHNCSKQLESGTFGENPSLHSVVTVSVLEGQLSVDQVAMEVRDVADSAAAELMACVKKSAEQLLLPADGHEDVLQFGLTMPFRLRR